MKKFLTLIAAVVIAVPFLAPRAEAQFTLIPYAGYDFDFESLFLGVGTEFDLPVAGLPFGLAIRPSAEYYFGDSESFNGFSASSTAIQLNGDVVAELMPAAGGIGVFAGAGLAMTMFRTSVEFMGQSESDTNSELGLNLFGGAEFGTGGVVPFAQFRLTTPGTTRLQLMGGVKITL